MPVSSASLPTRQPSLRERQAPESEADVELGDSPWFYNVEVCLKASLSSCKADDDSVWQSLDDFMNPAAKTVKEDAEPE